LTGVGGEAATKRSQEIKEVWSQETDFGKNSEFRIQKIDPRIEGSKGRGTWSLSVLRSKDRTSGF
jgi:hypothetical protein